MNAAAKDMIPEWMADLLYSGGFYAAIGAVFAVILVIVIFSMLLGRRKKKKTTAHNAASDNTAFDFNALLDTVSKRNGRTHSILLVASSLQDLPITVPVHTAVQLAASRKCLLIDLDLKRDALAHVFELAGAEIVPTALSPVPTEIENLDVWPAHFFSRLKQMNLKTLLAEAEKKYDVILLNVPYLVTHPDRTQIVRCADSAVVFARDKNALPPLMQILDAGDCRILKAFSPDPRH